MLPPKVASSAGAEGMRSQTVMTVLVAVGLA
jgi:hypothetical protein